MAGPTLGAMNLFRRLHQSHEHWSLASGPVEALKQVQEQFPQCGPVHTVQLVEVQGRICAPVSLEMLVPGEAN